MVIKSRKKNSKLNKKNSRKLMKGGSGSVNTVSIRNAENENVNAENLYHQYSQEEIYTPYFGNSESLEYIKTFLCAKPIKGDEDFDDTKYKGTRCERFLGILNNRNTFIKTLNDYTDKFGETIGKYIFDYIENTNLSNVEIQKNINYIKKQCENICRRSPVTKNNAEIRKILQKPKKNYTNSSTNSITMNEHEPEPKLNPNPQNRPLPYTPTHLVQQENPTYESTNILNFMNYLKQNGKCEAFKDLYKTNKINKANIQKTIFENKQNDITAFDIDELMNQLKNENNIQRIISECGLLFPNPLYESAGNLTDVNNRKTDEEPLYNTAINAIPKKNEQLSTISNPMYGTSYAANTLNASNATYGVLLPLVTANMLGAKSNESKYASVLTTPNTSTTNQYEPLHLVPPPTNTGEHTYEEIANISKTLLPIIEYLSEEGNNNRLTIFKKLVNANKFNNNTLTSQNLGFGTDIPKDILDQMIKLGTSEKTEIIKQVETILKKNDAKNALISYLLLQNDTDDINYENMRQLTNSNDDIKYERMRKNNHNRLERFNQIFINVCTKDKNEKCIGLNEHEFTSLFTMKIAKMLFTLTQNFDRNEIEAILLECNKPRTNKNQQYMTMRRQPDPNSTSLQPTSPPSPTPPTPPVQTEHTTGENSEILYTEYSPSQAFRDELSSKNVKANVTKQNLNRRQKLSTMLKIYSNKQQQKINEIKMKHEKNEANSKTKVKKVVKEELIGYLSDIKGSIINGKNRCERYQDIINSKSTKTSKNNFAGKFNNRKTENLSEKTNYLNELNEDELNEVVTQCKVQREQNQKQRDITTKNIKQYLINYLSDSAKNNINGLKRLQQYNTIFRNSKIRDKNEYIKSFNPQDVDNIYMATSRLSDYEIKDVIKKSEANKAKIQPNNEEYLRKRSEYNNYLAKLREDEKELEKKYINLEEIKRNINDYQNIKLNLNTRPKTKRTKKNNKKFIQNKKSFYNTYETNISEFKSKQTNLEKQIKDLEEKIISERKRLKKWQYL